MTALPTLSTARLHLRAFTPGDGSAVQRLAGEFAIADTTLLMPHPYTEGMADAWIRTHLPACESGAAVTLAITLDGTELVGAIDLRLNPAQAHAEMGYWIGTPFWGRGYATEAGGAMLLYGFETLGLHRIFAYPFARNPASARVLQKMGMRREGLLREHVRRWDRFEDVEIFAILRAEHDRLIAGQDADPS
jgi:RimJ/RimL family protein N-acetyltransferase